MIAGRAVRWTLWGATLLAVATIAVSSVTVFGSSFEYAGYV